MSQTKSKSGKLLGAIIVTILICTQLLFTNGCLLDSNDNSTTQKIFYHNCFFALKNDTLKFLSSQDTLVSINPGGAHNGGSYWNNGKKIMCGIDLKMNKVFTIESKEDSECAITRNGNELYKDSIYQIVENQNIIEVYNYKKKLLLTIKEEIEIDRDYLEFY